MVKNEFAGGAVGELPWQCEQCGETNGGAFELCWNCANERPKCAGRTKGET